MTDTVLRRIGAFALKAALYELSATPKPGLVDRNNSGAHEDMNFFTLITSAAALAEYFNGFAFLGFNTAGLPPEQVFARAREYGMLAEKAMFEATNGINTHKGLIFAMGLICVAAGRIYGRTFDDTFKPEEICSEVAALTSGLCHKEYSEIGKKTELTKGESVYLKYGITGARGHAENGYEIIRKKVYPFMSKLLYEAKHTLNDILVQTLLVLISNVSDTNVMSRCGSSGMEYAKARIRKVMETGGVFTPEGSKELLAADQDFISRRISPGGCADLLAVTVMLFYLEHPDFKI